MLPLSRAFQYRSAAPKKLVSRFALKLSTFLTGSTSVVFQAPYHPLTLAVPRVPTRCEPCNCPSSSFSEDSEHPIPAGAGPPAPFQSVKCHEIYATLPLLGLPVAPVSRSRRTVPGKQG